MKINSIFDDQFENDSEYQKMMIELMKCKLLYVENKKEKAINALKTIINQYTQQKSDHKFISQYYYYLGKWQSTFPGENDQTSNISHNTDNSNDNNSNDNNSNDNNIKKNLEARETLSNAFKYDEN